jgi:hypothetical protein
VLYILKVLIRLHEGRFSVFGYLRPYKPELKMKDFAVYKAVYCGLCHTLGRRYGFLSRMILSYDATLMCILGMSIKDVCSGFEKRRCPVKPHKKCDAARQNPVMDYWADESVILGYYKVKDNLRDGSLGKKTVSLLTLPFVSAIYKKAVKKNPFAGQCADEYIKAQTEAELKDCASIDEAAQPTAILMARLLSHNADGAAQSRVIERMGFFIGRWIYLADAADDLDKDIKRSEYNPFAAALPGNSAEKGIERTKLAESLLNSCVYEITAALALLEIRRYDDIIGNAFYLGLPEVEKAVLSGLDQKERKKRFSAIYRI